jgi:hypothetical protein
VALEVGVLRGDDGLTQHGRDPVVVDDHPPLGCELADDLAVARQHAGDGIGTVVVERADLRQVARIGEQDAANGAGHRGDQEQRDDGGAPRESEYDPGASGTRRNGLLHASSIRVSEQVESGVNVD